MSFRTMLKHRAKVLELTEGEINGYPTHDWQTVKDGTGNDVVIACFLDLNFIRRGKDPVWQPEAGRPADRSGVLFALATAPVTAASRIRVIKGPVGTYEVQQVVDEAWRPTDLHHIEVGVTEVAKQIAGQFPYDADVPVLVAQVADGTVT